MKAFDLNAGALAPVFDEKTLSITVSEGRIPDELRGTFYRNGPNPLDGVFKGNTMLDWWPEASMVHAVQFIPGSDRPVRYRNRWLRTIGYRTFHGTSPEDGLVGTNPNVSLLHFNSELLALGEGMPPLKVDNCLERCTAPGLRGSLVKGMTAHPKVDPETGQLVWFHASPASNRVRYGVNDRTGTCLVDLEFTLPTPVFMHDFAITASWSVLFDLNVALDIQLAQSGNSFPIGWDSTKTARLGVMPRMGGEIRWIEIESCFLQHVANAYEAGENHIVIDVVRYAHFLKRSSETGELLDNPLGELWRYEVNLQTREVNEFPLTSHGVEFPQINPRLCAAKHRYIYLAEQETDEEIKGVSKLDTYTGEIKKHDIPGGDQNGEPIFVPRTSEEEDAGFILLPVYRKRTDTTDFLILDAQNLDGDPVAVVSLPCRIPAGFHGAWVASENLG